jgi:hypothetical protein
VFPVVGSPERLAEHASGGPLGGADVAHAPRRPQVLHAGWSDLSRSPALAVAFPP